MSQINILTPEQEALIPKYQEKWRRRLLLTERIDGIRAEAAVRGAYAMMEKPEPEVVICPSPHAALKSIRANSAASEPPSFARSPEELLQNPSIAIDAFEQTVKIAQQQQRVQQNPLNLLVAELSNGASSALMKEIENRVPETQRTKDVLQQGFENFSGFFREMEEQMRSTMPHGNFESFRRQIPQNWQESFVRGGDRLDEEFGWIPFKEQLLNFWLKGSYQGGLIAKVQGPTKYLQIDRLLGQQLAQHFTMTLAANPPVLTDHTAITCTWLDFAFSVLHFPHDAKKWLALQGLVKYCGWIFVSDNTCIVCDRPVTLLLDRDARLHAENRAAMQFTDGYSIYALHGQISIPPEEESFAN